MTVGIKETLELVTLIANIKDICMKHLGDGFDKNDVAAIVDDMLNKQEMKQQLEMAIDGIDKVLVEVKDLSLTEKITLISAILKAII